MKTASNMISAAGGGSVTPPVPRPEKRRRRCRQAPACFAAVLASGLLLVCVYASSWLLEANHYASVRSIETEATFRDSGLMTAAWRLPVAEQYRRGPFEYQENQSFCGPASLANLLHSLGDPRSQDAVINGTRYQPWFGVLLGGLTLDQLADLLRQRTDQAVTVMRDLSLQQFRQELARANDPTRRYIVNFHRGPLFGRGHGHFSPVLAYLAARDLVLVGDVNPGFRPFLVRSERLWRAVDTRDPATGLKRGLLTLMVKTHNAPAPAESALSVSAPRASVSLGQ